MEQFKRVKSGRYTLVYRGDIPDITSFVDRAMNPDRRLTKGRGAAGLFEFDKRMFVCRQYLHGGWLRGITKGLFLGEKRAADELDLTVYLEENDFPVVEAVGYVSRKKIIMNDLYFISVYMNGAGDLADYFKSSGVRNRLRMAKKLGRFFFELGRLGVYHPDLHLRNVLVGTSGRLCFLDFDRAYRRQVEAEDYEKMFWRLDRYVRKYALDFGRPVDDRERLIFLRTFERLSGRKIISAMKAKAGAKEKSARLGWFIDRMFYKKSTNKNSPLYR